MSENQEKTEDKSKALSKQDFYFETPLYERIDYSDLLDNANLLRDDVDAYSAKNKTETTYSADFDWIVKLETDYGGHYGSDKYRGFGLVTLKCKRKPNDMLRFFLYNDEINEKVEKVGQFPSIASLQFADIDRKYNKVLSEDYLDEFKKAITTASHGYGVATFNYLRRIFEGLVFETFEEHSDKFDVDGGEFKEKYMEEKIEFLGDYLPSQLIEMKSIYRILSKGIHELDEETCLKYYRSLKLSIELILDQKIEQKRKNKRDKKVKNEIQDINQSLSGEN
jgi:hypothetical protein